MRLLSILVILCVPLVSLCQHAISGKVVSVNGEALQQASVFISNTSIGAYTNATGAFILNNVPEGNVTIVVSHVGYEVETVVIPAAAKAKRYIIQLQPKSTELTSVLVGKYDKRGWKKWGEAFSEAFIGTSVYAKNCIITNKDALYFVYDPKEKQLRAYAQEDLVIENKALGYRMAVTLVDFLYDLSSHVVDYQVYTLFSEMAGSDDDEMQWRKARAEVYSLSLMHFMRALHAQNLRNEGFQVRRIEIKPNAEKQRVQALYKKEFSTIRDSLNNTQLNDVAINKLIEKSFSKDSLLYYNNVLEEEDRTGNLHLELLEFKDIARPTDSNTVLFQFDDYLQITYTKAKEPQEYTAYKNKRFGGSHSVDENSLRSYPGTELMLTQGIPVEVDEKGFFNNSNLFVTGFWGWWEKVATRLPYEYEP